MPDEPVTDPKDQIPPVDGGEAEESETDFPDEAKGELVEFPKDPIRMPFQSLPKPVGRIAEGHPLARPMMWAIALIALILLTYIFGSIIHSYVARNSASVPNPISESYRESGAITYEEHIIRGWFLDSERQHFLSEDGKRFTYVNPHEREDSPVTGFWRIME
jgi:hypothetical protein